MNRNTKASTNLEDKKTPATFDAAELDSMSKEERQEINREIDIAVKKKDREPLSFNMSGVPYGIKFPVLFNIFLILFVGVAIFGAAIYIEYTEEQELAQNKDIDQRTAQRAIEIRLNQEREKFSAIEAELAVAKKAQNDLVQEFENSVAQKDTELENNIQEELRKLREELEHSNITKEEIAQKLMEKEDELRRLKIVQLTEFKQQQQAERKAQETEIQTLITNLQSAVKQQELIVKQSEAELTLERRRLEQETQEISNQLLEAQRDIQTLKTARTQREDEIKKFTLLHASIARLIEDQQLVLAKETILDANIEIAKSDLRNISELTTFKKALETYSSMIDKTIIAQNIIDQSSGDDAAELKTKIAELETTLASNTPTLTAETNELVDRIADLSQQLRRKDKQIAELRNQKTNNQQVLSTNSSDTTTSQVLNNIRFIANYLALTATGFVDDGAKQTIVDFISTNRVYREIIDTLLLAIDPTGSTEF